MAKKKNPCKFILLKTGEELNYDQARDFLFKNYDFNTKTLKSESYAVSIERPGEVSVQPEAGISREMAEETPQAGVVGGEVETRSNTPIAIKKYNPNGDNEVLTGNDAVLAEARIEKIISTSKTVEEAKQRIGTNAANYVFSLGNETEQINKFIQDRIDGKTKTSFAEWRKGKAVEQSIKETPQAKPKVVAEKGKVEEKIENITDSNVEQIGKTILAYHATPTGEVKSGKEAGIHIGTEKAAEQVKEARNLGKGQVVPVTVKINKPLVLSDMPTWSSNNLLAQLYNPSEGKYFGLSREQIRQVRDSDMTEKQKQQWVIDYLKKQGYDAIAYKNEAEDSGKYSYVVFDEKQITPTEGIVEEKVAAPLRDVESTAKALEGIDVKNIAKGTTYFHGTSLPKSEKDFTRFDIEKGRGVRSNAFMGTFREQKSPFFFITSEESVANDFANAKRDFFNDEIKPKEKHTSRIIPFTFNEKDAKVLDLTGQDYEFVLEDIGFSPIDFFGMGMYEQDQMWEMLDTPEFASKLKDLGYDAVKYIEPKRGIGIAVLNTDKIISPTNKGISEAYHADKAAGKETELTKAVEELLTPTEYEIKKEDAQPMLEGVRDGRPKEKGREVSPGVRAEEEAKREEEVKAEEKSVDERIKEAKKNLADLFSQTTRMGFAFDPKKQAEVQYNIHKTLVNLAKLYIEKGINTVADFANSLKLKVQDVQRAWDEANGGKVITEKMLEREPYDQDSIRKAILSEQINYAQTQSEQAAEQAINNGNTAFDDFNAAMTGDAVYDLMTPSQKKDFYNEQIAAFNTKAAIEQSQQTPPPPIEPATWWQRFKVRYINPLSRIQDIQKEFTERGMQIIKEANAFLKYELMIGKAQSKMEDVMNTAKDIYSRLKKDGGNVEELGLYMYALHAKERNENVAKERMEEFNEERNRLEDIISDPASTTKEIANAKKDLDDLVKGKGKVKLLPDGGSGMMNQTAAEIIQAVEDSGKKDLYDQYAKEFRDKIIIPRVEQMLDYGLIDKDQADKLLTQYQHYVPLQVVEKQRKGAVTGARGAGVRGKDVFKARGSALYNYTERYNPIFSAVWNFNNTISRGEANVAAKALLELAKLDKDNLIFEVGKPKYMPMYDSNGDIKGVIPFPSTFTENNSIELKIDGKPVFVKIKDTELLNAMKKNGAMRGIRGLAIINGWIRQTATLANPEFIVSNFIRDYETTLFNLMSVKKDYSNIDLKGLTKQIANPKNVYKAGKAIIADHKGNNTGEWGKYAKMYREYGGRTSWFLNENLDDFSKKMEKDIKQMGQGGSLGVKALNYIGERMYMGQLAAEQSMRLSTFKALIEKGVDPEDAASAAKNITVNFENKGTIMEFIDSLYLFASAQIKGTYRVTKTLVTSKKGQAFAAGLVAYGILESYLNDILGGEDDEEDRINEGDKERSFIIMHPKDPKAEPIKIPLFYGMNVFKYAGNVAYDIYTGKKSTLDGSLTIMKSIYNQVSPFQGPTLSQSLAPTAFDPFIQHAENKSYRDAPLKPEQPKFGPQKKESELYFKSARPFSITVAKYMNELTGGGKYERGAIDVSPELIDHYFDAITGGAGRFVANSAQTAIIVGQKIKARFEKEDAPPMELKNIPFVRLFRGGTKDKEYIRTVYDIWTVSGVDKLTPTQMERFNNAINKALKENVIEKKDADRLRDDIDKGQKLIINDDFIREHYEALDKYIKENNFAPLNSEEQKIVDKSIQKNALRGKENANSIEAQLDLIKQKINFKQRK